MPENPTLKMMRFLGAAVDAHDGIEVTLAAMERMLENLPNGAQEARPVLLQAIQQFISMRDAMGGMLTEYGGGQKIPEKRPVEEVH